MSHRPHKENANQRSLNDLRAEKVHFGLRPMHINPYLPELLALILRHPIHSLVQRIYSGFHARAAPKVVPDLINVLFSFSHQSIRFDLFVDGHVIAQ